MVERPVSPVGKCLVCQHPLAVHTVEHGCHHIVWSYRGVHRTCSCAGTLTEVETLYVAAVLKQDRAARG